MTTNVVGEESNRVEFQAAKEMTKAQSYAAFLVKLAKEGGALDAVDQDLRLLKTTISGHLNLKNTLTDVGVPMERKQKVIEEILAGKGSAAILTFLTLLSDLGQVKMLPQIAEEFARRLE
ncbi:MAG: F0F1 ATP synthase subunit delta, partial [Actinomycetota bacterium]|nr:F0F1 ATP synthase subunit delta [Actinomycetota bacterium]